MWFGGSGPRGSLVGRQYTDLSIRIYRPILNSTHISAAHTCVCVCMYVCDDHIIHIQISPPLATKTNQIFLENIFIYI